MTQTDILKILEKVRWVSAHQLELDFGVNQATIGKALRKLKKQKLIVVKKVRRPFKKSLSYYRIA
jgi:transcription initiation factor IIE alpha subunit